MTPTPFPSCTCAPRVTCHACLAYAAARKRPAVAREIDRESARVYERERRARRKAQRTPVQED